MIMALCIDGPWAAEAHRMHVDRPTVAVMQYGWYDDDTDVLTPGSVVFPRDEYIEGVGGPIMREFEYRLHSFSFAGRTYQVATIWRDVSEASLRLGGVDHNRVVNAIIDSPDSWIIQNGS